MKYFRLILLESGFKNVAILSGGIILAQAIGVAVQPIATRIYLPEEFGIVAIIVSLASMFTPVLNGQYDLCIVSAESEVEAYSVTSLALYLGVFMSILISMGIIIFNIINPSLFKNVGNWIYLVIPYLFLAGITNVLNSSNNRYEQYKMLAKVSLKKSLVSNGIKISLGFLGVGVIGLILAALAPLFAGLKDQSKHLRKNYAAILSVKKADLMKVLVKYKAQPLFSAPGIFVVSYASSIVPIFIGSLYGIKEVGYYSLAMGMLGLPISIISANVGKVFFRNASKEKAETGVFVKSFKSSLLMLIGISLIPFIILLLYSEPLFAIAFGTEWLRSGSFAKLLIPWYWMNFIVGSLVIGLIISGRQLLKLIIQCLFIVEILIVFFFVKRMTLPVESFLLMISYFYGATYLLLLFVIYKTSISKLSPKSTKIETKP